MKDPKRFEIIMKESYIRNYLMISQILLQLPAHASSLVRLTARALPFAFCKLLNLNSSGQPAFLWLWILVPNEPAATPSYANQQQRQQRSLSETAATSAHRARTSSSNDTLSFATPLSIKSLPILDSLTLSFFILRFPALNPSFFDFRSLTFTLAHLPQISSVPFLLHSKFSIPITLTPSQSPLFPSLETLFVHASAHTPRTAHSPLGLYHFSALFHLRPSSSFHSASLKLALAPQFLTTLRSTSLLIISVLSLYFTPTTTRSFTLFFPF